VRPEGVRVTTLTFRALPRVRLLPLRGVADIRVGGHALAAAVLKTAGSKWNLAAYAS
jgi:hypothetical protein